MFEIYKTATRLLHPLAACLLALFTYAATAAVLPPAKVVISAPKKSADGLFHLRYPNGDAPTGAGPCPASSSNGALALKVSQPRTSGISPFLAFFDATATTDTSITGGMTAFQDVTYTWDFGDTGTSGTGTWAYGSNPGHNSKNTATGGIAAHLYITQGGDTSYPVKVTAKDAAGNTASCYVGGMASVTAFDPSGSNGFATTICQFATTLGSGCPAGASVSNSSSETANVSSSMSNKRVLFKCGDSFSGGMTAGGTKFSIGAYGGCEGTQTSRPIFSGGVSMSNATTDGRLADIDFESSGGSGTAFSLSTLNTTTASQITLSNLKTQGWFQNFYWVAANQIGLIGANAVSFSNATTPTEGSFLQYGENNCLNGVSPGPSDVYQCGQGSGAVYQNIAYMAVIGSHFGGPGTSTSGYETVRIAACRLCVLTNSDYGDAGGTSYSPFKFHSGDTWSSKPAWIGQYTELVEISDNLFYGHSGAQLAEVCPQNGDYDERLRNIVIERNIFAGSNGSAKALALSAVNATVRDNVFHSSSPGVSVAMRGTEWTSCTVLDCGGQTVSAAPNDIHAPELIEVYNNTCTVSTCVTFQTWGNFGAFLGFNGFGNNSVAKNNLAYNAGGGTVVSNGGSGNTVSDNTTSITANPGFTNGSGTFSLMSDFKPTANFSGGACVPVLLDALGVTWGCPPDLGAVHH